MATGFPVKGVNNSTDVLNKLIKESNYNSIELFGSNTSPLPNSGSTTVVAVQLLPTEVFYATSATMTLTGGSRSTVQLQYMCGPNNAGTGTVSNRFPLFNNGITFPINSFITAGSEIKLNLRDGDASSSLFTGCNISGYRVSADTNYGAEKVIMWIGDSITRGSNLGATVFNDYTSNILTATTCNDHFAFQVKNNFQSRGIDCRLVTKAMGSYTSREMGFWLRQGFLDIDQVDLIVYQLGTNDVTKSTTDQQFTDEINRIIDWRNRVYKKIPPILFLGSTPLNNTTNEARLAQLRTIESNIVTSASAGSKLYYLSLQNAFDPTVINNYTASDGTHPNIANNKLIGDKINAWVSTNNFIF